MRDEEMMHEGNRKKEHTHHMTRFSNVLHFDVAHFEIIQPLVRVFVLKMLRPQREEHKNISPCVKPSCNNCELERVLCQTDLDLGVFGLLGV